MRGRAQTEFDYLVGMGLLLLTLTGVFLFVPGVFGPFEDPVDTDKEAAASRIADRIVAESAVDGSTNTLDQTALESRLGSTSAVRARSGIPPRWSYNVTVENTTGESVLLADGPAYANDRGPAATTVRIVRLANASSDRCEPACRLVVRVW